MEIENYNQQLETYLKEMGIKKIKLKEVLGLSKTGLLNKFSVYRHAVPYTKNDFEKVITYFKNKSNELYNNAIKE